MSAAEELLPRYAQAGIAVLPLHSAPEGRCTCGRADCPSPGKHPRLKHGAKEASTDIGQIAEWMARWGDTANWGGCPPPGVVILDLDPRNNGWESLRALEDRHTRLPATLTAKTGSDGRHYWFSYSGPARGKVAPGLDVKTSSGYVVLPPSRHACSGSYAWIRHIPAAPAPRWLQLTLNPPSPRFATVCPRAGGSTDALVRFVSSSQEGDRNSRLFWAACRAHEAGAPDDVLAALVAAAESVGLPRIESESTVRSAATAPRRKAPA